MTIGEKKIKWILISTSARKGKRRSRPAEREPAAGVSRWGRFVVLAPEHSA